MLIQFLFISIYVFYFTSNGSISISPNIFVCQKMTLLNNARISEPNNESPLNPYAAELWRDQTKYKKQLTEEYHKSSSRGQQDSW